MIKKFTLVELLMSIVILSILASIVVVETKDVRKKAEVSSLNSNIRQVQLVVDAFYTESEDLYPTDKQPTDTLKTEPIVWDKVKKTLGKIPREALSVSKKTTFYVDPYGRVLIDPKQYYKFLTQGSDGQFLEYAWLRNTDMIVTDPTSYGTINPPKGAVFLNYDMNRNDFSNFKGHRRILTFGAAITGSALLDAYKNTKDPIYLSRAKVVADYLKTMTVSAKMYSVPETVVSPERIYSASQWKRVDQVNPSESWTYMKDSIVVADMFYKMSTIGGDSSYETTANNLMSTVAKVQANTEGSADHLKVKGMIPEYLLLGVDANNKKIVKMTWTTYPTDLAYFIADAYLNGKSTTNPTAITTVYNKYFERLNALYKSKEILNAYGYPYEYMRVDFDSPTNEIKGINQNQDMGMTPEYQTWGQNMAFTTDQYFYFVNGMIAAKSPYAQEIHQKSKTLIASDYSFYGQYNANGTPYVNPDGMTYKETINMALYVMGAKQMNSYKVKETVNAMKKLRLTTAFRASNQGYAWAEHEPFIENVVSAIVPMSMSN